MEAQRQFFTNAMELIAHADILKDSIIGTLGAICGEDPVFDGDFNWDTAGEGVVGIISIVGDVAWNISLCVPRSTTEGLILKFAGFEIEYDSADMGDVVGELVNVIAGDTSARLDAVGVKADLSLPTIAKGSNLQLLLPEGVSVRTMQFSSSDGKFWVKLAAGCAR